MSRLPIRLRLTLAFALAMGVVLAVVGAFLYVRLGDSLEEQLDDSLELRAQALAALVRERGNRAELGANDESVAQLYLLERPPREPLISQTEAQRAKAGPFFVRRDEIAAFAGGAGRLLVTTVDEDVLVVGASLEDREEALEELLTQLLIVGPIALLLSTLAGLALAGAALSPVEAMTRQAAEVSSERAGQLLPLPRANDEIRRLGETLNAMLGRLEAGIARERRFVADASHELRTPLALLRTELELALRRPRSHEELAGALGSALEEVDRLSRLAEDLLVLARAEEGRLPLQRSSFRAAELLETVTRRFAARAASEERAIELAVPGGEIVTGDRLRLEQALGNLVDNALRHGRGGVRINAGSTDGRSELRVADEGDGFPVDFLPRAFERFARADESRGGGAAGLGLAIVAAIAHAHGGSAHASNSAQGGAVVSLTLPADPAGQRHRERHSP